MMNPVFRPIMQKVFKGVFPREEWSPLVLFSAGEIGVWFDPSDPLTVFTDTAGTTPAAVGDAVARINDKSGNGIHATQSTLAYRPILREAVTGERYLEFNGLSMFMSTASYVPGSDKAQVFSGVRKLSDTTLAYVATHNTGLVGSWQVRAPGANGSASYSTAYRGNTATVTAFSGIVPAPSTNILSALFDAAAPSQILRVDGVPRPTVTTNPGTGVFATGGLLLGAVLPSVGLFNGHLFNFVARFGDNLDAASIANAEAYIAGKTAGVSLP